MRLLQPGHGAHQGVLDIERQAGGNAVRVVLVRAQALGLQKNLVAVLVGKAVDLVFHAGTVARPYAFDLAGEHGAAVKAAADDLVRAFIGVGDPARHLLRVHAGSAQKAEHRHPLPHPTGHAVARLFGAAAEVNAAPIDARRRAGLEPALRQLQLLQPCRQADGRRITSASGCVVVQADMDLAVQKSARREHHGTTAKAYADLGHGTDYALTFHHQIVDRLLEQPQIGLILQPATDRRLVQNTVRLRPRGPHRRPLAGVEDAKLNAALVGRNRHRPTQGIDLLHQVTLAYAAYRRVAAHLAQGLNIVAQQQGLAAHARSGQRGLGASMATADNDHVKFFRVVHGFPSCVQGRVPVASLRRCLAIAQFV